MKKVFLFAMVAIFGLTSCNKIKDVVNKISQFNVPPISNSATLPELSQAGSIEIKDTIVTNAALFLSENSISTNLIDSIRIQRMELTIDQPQNGNFNFLNSADLYFSTLSMPTELKVATFSNITAGLKVISATLPVYNLKDYFIANKIAYRLVITTNAAIPAGYQVTLKSTFKVRTLLANY